MPTFYLDYTNGDDAADGSTFALGGLPAVGPWKTVTFGATAARIAPGDVIRIAKSPDTTSLGITGVWTNGPIPATVAIVSSTNANPIAIHAHTHGLSTGDIVFITGHTTNTEANGAWIVSVSGVDDYTLDGSIGNGVGGATGTCQKWNSKCIKLASALNATIDNCDLIWTETDGADCTPSVDTTIWKEGYGSCKLVITATAGVEKIAYRTLTSIDLSSYKQISFWFKSTVALASGDFQIKLCSDTTGDTPVDTFNIPAYPGTENPWAVFTVDKASALGAAIQSVALYQAVDKGACTIYLDNIIACKDSSSADSLSLTSLISKNSAAQGGNEGFYGLQSIKGTIVVLDNNVPTLANAGRGYMGTTETVTTYKREPIRLALVASTALYSHTVQDSGSSPTAMIEFQGGYDTGSNIQNGETFFDGGNGLNYAFVSIGNSFIKINRLNFNRCYLGIVVYLLAGVGAGNVIDNIQTIANCVGGVYSGGLTTRFNSIRNLNNNSTYGFLFQNSNYGYGQTILRLGNVNNNGTNGVEIASGWNFIGEITSAKNNNVGINGITGPCNRIWNANLGSNTLADVQMGINPIYFMNTIMDSTTEVITNRAARIYSQKHDGVVDNNWSWYGATSLTYSNLSTSNFQTTTKYGSVGAWRIRPSSFDTCWRMIWPVIRVAVESGKTLTVTAPVKKDHATDVSAQLMIRGGQVAGIASDVIAVKADDTDWEELTVSGTPSEDGCIEIELELFTALGSATNNIYLDGSEITVTSV